MPVIYICVRFWHMIFSRVQSVTYYQITLQGVQRGNYCSYHELKHNLYCFAPVFLVREKIESSGLSVSRETGDLLHFCHTIRERNTKVQERSNRECKNRICGFLSESLDLKSNFHSKEKRKEIKKLMGFWMSLAIVSAFTPAWNLHSNRVNSAMHLWGIRTKFNYGERQIVREKGIWEKNVSKVGFNSP